jgi:hypothetical protein
MKQQDDKTNEKQRTETETKQKPNANLHCLTYNRQANE